MLRVCVNGISGTSGDGHAVGPIWDPRAWPETHTWRLLHPAPGDSTTGSDEVTETMRAHKDGKKLACHATDRACMALNLWREAAERVPIAGDG